MPTGRIERVFDRLTFQPGAVELDIVLPNLAGALQALEQIAPQQLAPALLALNSDVLETLEKHSRRELAEMSRGARSRSISDRNPERGHYGDAPIAALFSVPEDQVASNSLEEFHAALGLLLAARLHPNAAPEPIQLEKDVASDIRKCFTADTWRPARAVFPDVGPDLVRRLRLLQHATGSLPPSQQHFFRAFSRLVSDTRFRSFERIEPRLPEDEPPDTQTVAGNIVVARRSMPQAPAPDTEPDDLPAFLLEVDPDSRKPGQDETSERLRLFDAAHRFVRDNQFLPYHSRSLLPNESTEVARVAMVMMNEADHADAAFIGAMVQMSGHPVEEILEFVVIGGNDFTASDIPWGSSFIDLASGRWWHSGPHLRGRFSPKPEQRELLLPHAQWIGLQIPEFILAFLRKRVAGKAQTIEQITSIYAAQADALLIAFCKEVRERSPWTRAYPARLRANAFDWWVRQTSDDTAAAQAHSNTEYSPTPPLFYYAAGVDELQARHLQRMQELGWPVSPTTTPATTRFGSALQPTSDAIACLITRLTEAVESTRLAYREAPSPKSIAAAHNAVAIYTIVMLIFATGHRRAIEYCLTLGTISPQDFLLVVADKIVSAANAARVVGLPAIAIAQLHEYVAHLVVLAARVGRYAPDTAVAIRSLTDSASMDAKVHLFGVLSDDLGEWAPLSVGTIEEMLADVWPIPMHAPRHVLETDGRREGLSAEFNHYRAGHIGLGQQPWSQWSPLIPAEVLRDIANVSDKILLDQGWMVRPGIEGRPRSPSHAELTSLAHQAPTYTPTPIDRARAVGSSASRRWVHKAIRSVKAKSQADKYSDEEVAAMRQVIMEGSAGDEWLAAAALNLLRRWLNRHHRLLRSTKVPGLVLPASDPPVFTPDLVTELRAARDFRSAILAYFARHKNARGIEARARILVSFIAFAGFVRHEWMGPAIAALGTIFTADKRLWIELERRGSDNELVESVRRPLDPVSSCLFLQYRNAGLVGTPEGIDSTAVLAEANQVLQRIRAEAGSAAFPGSVTAACHAMVPFFRFHLPGILAAIGDGRADGHCLPRADFIRVIEGHPTIGSVEELESPERKARTKVAHDSEAMRLPAKAVLKAVGDILREALPPSALGGKQESEFQAKRAKALQQITDIPLPNPSPSVVHLLIQWVRLLLDEGGRSGRKLQPSSIRTYWHRVATPLLDAAMRVNFNVADEEELEDLYCQVLDVGPRRSRPRRARVLRDFHERCGNDLPELDWYEIEPRINLDNSRVDANLITPAEYQRVQDKLIECGEFRPDYARSLACFLILMYRGGMRIGDCIRLTLEDVRLSGGEVVIYVRRNRFGRPKTRAGRRIVRLTAPTLRPSEHSLIVEQLSFRRELCRRDAKDTKGDAEIAFLGPSSDGLELYDRQALQDDLCDLLRWATGRPGSRPHHLRHSYGSFSIAAVMPIDRSSVIHQQLVDYFGADDPARIVLTHHLNDARPSRRVVHAISAELGHASPDTTFAYEHLHEFGLASCLWNCAPERLDEMAVSATESGKSKYAVGEALTGLTNVDIRQLKARGQDVGDPRVLAELMLKRQSIWHGVEAGNSCDLRFKPQWARKELCLESVHLALIAGAEDAEASVVAQRSGLSESVAMALISGAKRHRPACEFQEYFSSGQGNQNCKVEFPPVPTDARSHGMTSRFNAMVGRISEPVIQEGVDVWAANYRPSVPGLGIGSATELVAALRFILATGLPSNRCRLSLPDFFSDDEKREVSRLVTEAQLPQMQIESHKPSKGQARSSLVSVHVLLEDTKGSDTRARNMRLFHQLCYLLWVTSIAKQRLD